MKNNLLKLLIAGSVLATGLAAEDMDTTEDSANAISTGKYAGANGIYVGGTLGGGSGSWSLTDGDTTWTPPEDGISTTDMKIYAGKRSIYGFIQTGTVSFDGSYADMDYTAIGVGYLGRIDSWRQNFAAGSLMPEFDAEIAFDSMTEGNDDFAGFLLSADLGVAVSLLAIPELEFTAGVGYDLHAVKDDANSDYTYNFGSVNFNIGAKYNF